MVYEPTIHDTKGIPIADLLVTVNNLMTGAVFSRSTDGTGYANVAMPNSDPTHRVTIAIQDPAYRFKGRVQGDWGTVAQANDKFLVVLDPFV